MDADLTKLLRTVARELDELDADWAVGGAVAMGTHGFVRATQDIDLFIADEVREDLLERLSAQGIYAEEVFEPVHYTIVPRRQAADVRLDLLFPASAPETLAMMQARRAKVAGVDVPVWPLEHLVAAKLLTDPLIDPDRARKDGRDLDDLHLRGLVDRQRVLGVLDDVGDRGARERLHELVRDRRRK